MATPKFVQAQSFQLQASGASAGDTSIVVQSFKYPDGTTNIVTADLGDQCYGTIEPNNGAQEEAIQFTGVTQNAGGTATLTGVSSVGFKYPYTVTSGLAKSHAGGVTFILSNDAALYGNLVTYVNNTAASGAALASSTINGLTKLSVDPVSPSAPIAIGANDPAYTAAGLASSIGALLFPIGSLYTATVSTNPNTLLGFGTWSAFGAGRVLIGAGTGTKVATFASRSSNVITVTGLTNATNNEFQTGQAVLYSAPSGAMTGLTHNTTYYLIRTGNLTFSLATSLANAQNGTVISLSSDGSGVQTFTLTLTVRTGGDTGGEENHAMSSTEILAHTHTVGDTFSGSGSGTVGSSGVAHGATVSGSVGGNAAMNVMQPFITVYMWTRTA